MVWGSEGGELMQQKILGGTKDDLHDLGGGHSIKVAGHEVTSLARCDSGWWTIFDGQEVWHSSSNST